MLEKFSFVHRPITNELDSYTCTFETTHLKQLPSTTFVIRTPFKPNKLSNKLKLLLLGLYNFPKHLSDVTYELLAQDGSTFLTHRYHFYRTIVKSSHFSMYFSIPFKTISYEQP